jgi:protein TonB
MTPGQHPDQLDLLMEDVLHEVANPTPDSSFETRTHRSIAMSTTAAAPTNPLTFTQLDRAAGRRMSPQSVGIAVLLNIAALLLLMVQVRTAHLISAAHEVTLIEPPPLPRLPPKSQTMGGGGGQPDKAPVTKGNPPKFAVEQLDPPKAPPLIQPKIAVPATVDVDPNIHMAHVDMPTIGMPNSPNIGTSMGNGNGSGMGSGNGAGIGAGSGGGMGGGVHRIGGGVSAPQVLYEPEPQFSEEARKAKAAGIVTVYLQVDTTGTPRNVRVVRGIGMGLDEKALDAVRHYKFKPAMENGHPVVVEMNVEVNFQIF